MKDPLYFPRTELSKRILISLKEGITHALTLFAPRRMGKTQFLLNDIKPNAEEMGFKVFYFSFMEQSETNINKSFVLSLIRFLNDISQGSSKLINMLKTVKGVEVLGVGIELENSNIEELPSISQVINELAIKSDMPILLLLDEIQELARIRGADSVIKSLRTGLDVNQNKIKVIFTGSSTNGLRAMFNDTKAPFFHFAHPLEFPNLDKKFTDFLANIYTDRTGNTIDKDEFYNYFSKFNFTPLYMRSVTQDMIINPNLNLSQAVELRISQMEELTDNQSIWSNLSELEKLLLILIARGETSVYSKNIKLTLSKQLGIETLTNSSIQGKIRKLVKMDLITKTLNNTLKINNSYFKTWILENK